MTSTARTLAVAMAEKSNHEKWKIGSVVWRGGSVLGKGHNRQRNSPAVVEDEKYYHCSVHAEVDALKNSGETNGAKIFVARITKGGNIGLAKPCPRCYEAIKESGIKKVYYTTSTGEWKEFRV